MKKYVYLMIFSLVAGIVMNMGHPVTPQYIYALQLPEEIFGYCFAIMSLGMLIMAPIWGNIGDLNHRKMAVALGICGYGIGQILFGFANDAWSVLLARFVSGSFSAAIMVSGLAYISANNAFSNIKGKAISGFVSFNVFGASIGYLIGGQLGTVLDAAMVLRIQGLICLLVAVCIFIFGDFSNNIETQNKQSNFIRNFKNISKLPLPMLLFIFTIFLVSISQTNTSRYVDVFVSKNGYNSAELGAMVFVTGLVTLGVNAFITPLLLRGDKQIRSLIITLLISCGLVFVIFRQENLILSLYTGYMVYIGLKALYEPLIVNHMSEIKKVNIGVLLGVRQSAIALGQIVGPIIGAYIFKINMLLLFDVSGIILLASSLLFIIYVIWQKHYLQGETPYAN